MNIFTLFATIVLNDQAYKQGLKSAQESTKKAESGIKSNAKSMATAFKTVVAAVGIVSATVVKLITSTANYGSEIADNSQKIGISTKAYQEWSYILQQNGTDIGSLDAGMKTFTNLIVEASQGNADALISFSKLGDGISYADFAGLSIEDTFAEIIKRFQEMPDGAEKNALAFEIFGRSGQDLIPILNMSSEEVSALRDNFYDLGVYLDEDAVAAADKAGDQFDDLKLVLTGIKNTIGTALLPAFTAISEWIKNNQELFLWISGFVVGLIATIWLLNAALNANPAVLIITGIIVAIGLLVAGIVWLVNNWDEAMAALDKGWKWFVWGVSTGFISLINFLINGINAIVKGILSPLNAVIDGLNFIPGVNIKRVSLAIPTIPLPDIPKFGTGGIIDPNNPFMAIVGDNTREQEIISPLSTMKKAVTEAILTMKGGVTNQASDVEGIVNGFNGVMRQNKQVTQPVVYVQIGDKEIKSFIVQTVDEALSRLGRPRLSGERG